MGARNVDEGPARLRELLPLDEMFPLNVDPAQTDHVPVPDGPVQVSLSEELLAKFVREMHEVGYEIMAEVVSHRGRPYLSDPERDERNARSMRRSASTRGSALDDRDSGPPTAHGRQAARPRDGS